MDRSNLWKVHSYSTTGTTAKGCTVFGIVIMPAMVAAGSGLLACIILFTFIGIATGQAG